MILCPNTSPLLVLARIDRLDLLGGGTDIVITRAVLDEVLDKADEAADRIARLAAGCDRAEPEIPPGIDDGELGPGEQSVLAHALGAKPHRVICVLDDAAARRRARQLGLELTGTLGVILRAKSDGRIDAASPVLEAAVAAGLYLDDRVVAAALEHVGER